MFDSFQNAQRLFHDTLATDMHRIHDAGGLLPLLALVAVGFIYGVFHAVGPGHGKIVVTSYMLAGRSSLKRGLIIVLLSSLLQAVVAIALVLGLFLLLGLARTTTEHAASLLEVASFGLIALVGLRLMVRGVREVRALFRPKHDQHHHHDHDHSHHHHHHDDHCGCGHAHMPGPAEIDKAQGWGDLAAMVLSIGIRPCSGAIILLLFACLIGVVVPGVIATFAMALGTALTTGLLAVAAVTAKAATLRAVKASGKTLAVLHAGLSLGGGLLVVLMGLFFLIAGINTELAMPDIQPNALPTMHLPGR